MVMKASSRKKHSRTLEKQEEWQPSSRKRMRQSKSLIELWPEQEKAVQFVLQRNETALFFEQRTGKTFITLKVLEELSGPRFAGVVVCLLNNKDSTWRDRFDELLPWMNVTSNWEEFKQLDFPKVLLVHHDALHTMAKKINGKKWITFCVVDESHRWKARGSRMSRAGAQLRHIPRKLILSGTPIEKQPKDLWAQFRFLKPELFGSWAEFEEEYMNFEDVDMTGVKPGSARWQIKMMKRGMLRHRATFKDEKMPQLLELLKPVCLRLTKEDAGILRPKIIPVAVDLAPYQQRLYDRMTKHSVIKLRDGTRVMAPMKVTQIIKRRELASGFVYDDEDGCHLVGDANLIKLLEMFERLPKPVVIFTEFDVENILIAEALDVLGYDIETLTGSTPKRRRAEIQRGFQRAQYDALVCQSRAGGVGIDLWKANSAIAHSMGYSSITFEQMASRLDAKHKKKPAKIFVLCARSTIDEELYDLVIDKGFSSEAVLKHLKGEP